MFIEALSLLAANENFRLESELHREPAWYAPAILDESEEQLLPFARLRLEAGAAQPAGPRYEESVFMKRRTSRLSLSPELVPRAAAQALAELAQKCGQRYEQITDPAVIERLLAKNTEALFEDLNSPDYHDELAGWFRFTDRAARRTRDGLDYRCMNSSRVSFWLAARAPWLLRFPLTRPLLARIYRSQLGTVPTVGLISGPFWRPEDAVETGRFLMQFWLETARRGLYIHPYGNLVTNARAARWCLEETGVEGIWLIFKIGFSVEPPESYRLPLEEVIVD
jgi:hypothetical protein